MTEVTITPEAIGEHVLLVGLCGEVDLANAGELGPDILAHVPNSALAIVLDLAGVAYFDGAGIQMLFDVASALRCRQQELRVVVPAGVLRDVLELVQFEAVAPLAADVDGALADLRQAA